jgi:hypothetical protein
MACRWWFGEPWCWWVCCVDENPLANLVRDGSGGSGAPHTGLVNEGCGGAAVAEISRGMSTQGVKRYLWRDHGALLLLMSGMFVYYEQNCHLLMREMLSGMCMRRACRRGWVGVRQG